jgi:trehalose 6-phosphate phosphatase
MLCVAMCTCRHLFFLRCAYSQLNGMTEMQKIALSPSQHALFLDFDGTLVDIAPHPHAVQVHANIITTLHDIYSMFNGALAIVSGRCVADIDKFLYPLLIPVAGEHGAQWRNTQGDFFEIDSSSFASALEPIVRAAQLLAQQNGALLLEPKTVGFALHYRMAPALYTLCWNTLLPMVQRTSGLALMRGKYVMEVIPIAVNKGAAIGRFMCDPPFEGRTPIFIGDDVTDEAGFTAVQGVGGYGIKMGAGPSVALYRCPNPAALRAWLEHAVATLQGRMGAAIAPMAHTA